MSSYTGIDGTVHITDEGLTFKRTKLRAAGRGVPPVHLVPWSAVVGADVDKAALRVRVAGHEAPRMNTSDPHAVAFKRGQGPTAAAFASRIGESAAGVEARPRFDEGRSAPVPAVTPARPAPATGPDQTWSRVLRLTEIALWLQIVALVAVLAVPIAIFVFVFLALR